MSGKIKMIGLDLDGTLLTDKKELTERSKEVIAKALRQGIIVLLLRADRGREFRKN